MNTLKLILLSVLVASSVCSLTCDVCQNSVKVTAQTLSFLIPDSIAVQGLEALCMRRYDSEKLCKKVGEEIAPLAISNFVKNKVNPSKRCSSVCNGSFVHYNSAKEVQRILSGNSLEKINLSTYIQVSRIELEPKKNLRILHLSDIHQDKNYVEKSSINCEYPICCHEQNGFPQNPSAQAKPFGSKSCDSPPKLLDSFLDFMEKQPQIDIILGTGDFSAHNQWEKTDQSIIQTQNSIEQKIKAKFPNSIFIKAQGNNDYVPDHQYDASKSPKLIQQTDVIVGQTKLTFVALNTIAFDDFNLYLLGDQSYAIFQLMLIEQILENNDNVYILGHIPPTLSGTAEQYAAVYRALVAKYSSKIKGQFFGHTHSDQLTINTYPNTDTATGFGFICPSMSPLYIGTSRSRIYKLQVGQANGVSDYTQYILTDLSSSVAKWSTEYRFREKYHLAEEDMPLTLKQMSDIKLKIFSNKEQQRKYIRNTGLNPEYGKYSHCLILDDFKLRKKCGRRSESLTDKLYTILDILRGQWGYERRLIKQ